MYSLFTSPRFHLFLSTFLRLLGFTTDTGAMTSEPGLGGNTPIYRHVCRSVGRYRYWLGVVACLLLSAGLPPAAQAQTIRYVSTTGTNNTPATATTWAASTTNLQGAINASASGDQVWVAGGTYKPTGPPDRTCTDPTISFSMKNGVAIYGGFVGTENSLSERPVIDPVAG